MLISLPANSFRPSAGTAAAATSNGHAEPKAVRIVGGGWLGECVVPQRPMSANIDGGLRVDEKSSDAVRAPNVWR